MNQVDKQSHNFSYGLRANVLSHFETLAQSISCLAPTATPAVLIPLVFATAGNGSWLAYLIATLVIAVLAANMNQFASRSASPGSIYTYVAIGLGPGMGLLTGWLLLSAYIIVISAVEAQFTIYAAPLMKTVFGFAAHPVALMLFATLAPAYIAWRDIKLSASVMLILEFCSVGLILLLMSLTLIHKQHLIDWQQIKLTGVTFHSLLMGLVFAIFGFTGLESAASLGSEAKDPLENIPKAIKRSGLWSGIFYTMCAYIMTFGFSGSATSLANSGAALIELAKIDNVSFLGTVLSCGAVISFFACNLSCINTSARLLFMMGHHGLLPTELSSAHRQNRTPHVAVIIVTILGALPGILMSLMGCSVIDIMSWTGNLAAYSFILSYAFVCLAAPAYLRSLGELRWVDSVIAATGCLMLLIALVGNIDPKATGVAQFLPHIFIALIIFGALWYLYLKVFAQDTIKAMAADMESLRRPFLHEERV